MTLIRLMFQFFKHLLHNLVMWTDWASKIVCVGGILTINSVTFCAIHECIIDLGVCVVYSNLHPVSDLMYMWYFFYCKTSVMLHWYLKYSRTAETLFRLNLPTLWLSCQPCIQTSSADANLLWSLVQCVML